MEGGSGRTKQSNGEQGRGNGVDLLVVACPDQSEVDDWVLVKSLRQYLQYHLFVLLCLQIIRSCSITAGTTVSGWS